ncbi:unnamed protein product [Meganyctiphanes norvegica]|uniref:Uncharacterized protein n=1 Tax=Meganyctiphanes norvegica TaxID=48144 RepID=A0AAV2SBG2_MEGNR
MNHQLILALLFVSLIPFPSHGVRSGVYKKYKKGKSIFDDITTGGVISGIYEKEKNRKAILYDTTGNTTTLFSYKDGLLGDWDGIEQYGIWVYYSDEGYQGLNVTAAIGEGLQFQPTHPVRSVRYVGNSRDQTLPAAVLYAGTWFTGEEYIIELGEEDGLVVIPNFRGFGTKAKSLIIVGSEWTFFGGENLVSDDSVVFPCNCLRPTHFTVTDDQDIYSAAFFPDLEQTNFTGLGSAVLGCKTPMQAYCGQIPEDYKPQVHCPIVTTSDYQYCN